VWHEGKQVPLAVDEKEAYEKWHDLMALSRVTTAGDRYPFKAVAEQFLDWISRNKTKMTYKTNDEEPDGNVMTFRGIYALDGDTLKWCLNHDGTDVCRPEEFRTKKGSPLRIFTFKKVLPKK
jgi:uncharacterized protein (TIGR03067 family)